MALKPCPECGNEISSLATTCPNCGRYIQSRAGARMKRNGPGCLVMAAIFVVVVGALVIAGYLGLFH